MIYLKVLVLALIQGAAELLPVSSSAHVILAEKLMGEKPSDPRMVYLLIMLHTGTMFAAIIYFWSRWKPLLFPSKGATGLIESVVNMPWWLRLFLFLRRQQFLLLVLLATAATGILGLGLKYLIEKVFLGYEGAQVEDLFDNLWLIGSALTAAGLLILASSVFDGAGPGGVLTWPVALLIGLVQGLCLPFRGFSRSGATISVGLVCGLSRKLAEEYSFALAVVLTPPLIVRQTWKLLHSPEATNVHWVELLLPGLIGMVLAFLSGLAALRLLSAALEKGRWVLFGVYCLAFAGVVFFAAWWGV